MHNQSRDRFINHIAAKVRRGLNRVMIAISTLNLMRSIALERMVFYVGYLQVISKSC